MPPTSGSPNFYINEASGDDNKSSDVKEDPEWELKIFLDPESIVFEMSKGIAYLSAALPYPQVDVKADFDYAAFIPISVNQLYFSLVTSGEMTIGVEAEGKISAPYLSFHKDIASFPIQTGIPGITVDIVLSVNFEFTGTAIFDCSFTSDIGMELIGDRIRTTNNSQDVDLEIFLAGEFDDGLNLGAELKLFNNDLIADVTAKFGLAVELSLTDRFLGWSCADINCWFYTTVTALDKKSYLKDLTGLSAEWELINKDNSPYKINRHYEGTILPFEKVSQCTYGEGFMFGSAQKLFAPTLVSPFTIMATKTSGFEPYEYSEIIQTTSGLFKIDDLPAGTYTLVISADGYRDIVKEDIKIVVGQGTNLGKNFFFTDYSSRGSASGQVTDSLTGSIISGATVKLRPAGVATSPVKTVMTTSTGTYSFTDVECGNYIVLVSIDGYGDESRPIIVAETGSNYQNVTLNPVSAGTNEQIADLRIILTWSGSPLDLDSHLCGPTRSGAERFHVYYNVRSYEEGGHIHAKLDRDKTWGFGPETSTVYDINPSGKYSFYVYNFSEPYYGKELSRSEAIVRVYIKQATGDTNESGEALYRLALSEQFYVPLETNGPTWHVFDYNAGTGILIPYTTFFQPYSYKNIEGLRI
jgi:hypothetical protein